MSGRATSAGVLFQSEVGAYVAALLLTERSLSRLGDNLPGNPLKIFMETSSAVDDVNVVTDKGLVYFQVKTSLSLSENPSSELGSVIDQFVRQYRDGVIYGIKNREMDATKDRLVLAVSENAPASVRINLREALARHRTDAATALPANLKSALDTVKKLVANVWLREEGTPITHAKCKAILMVFSVAVLDSNQKQLVTDALRDVVKTKGSEANLFKLLVGWASEASRNGTGGDQSAIRLSLQGKISLKEPPSFQPDVDKLSTYSNNVLSRLERFTYINTDVGRISFSRLVSPVILSAVNAGSLAITGDPGSGKSGIIHKLSEELSEEAFVVTLTVENNITTLDALQKEIGLEHPVFEVLKNIPLDNNGYLILDALDATRGGPAEMVYKKLIVEASSLPNWYVVASVRTFDLKLGLEWKRLFRGTPSDTAFSYGDFRSVRHVHVPLLSEEEIKEIGNKSPSLKTALEYGGSKMATLARNLFNLSLIGELITGGVLPTSLAEVSTRSELLSRYWEERMADLGLPGTVAMKKFVELILSQRSVDIPETDIPLDAAAILENMQIRGVLVTEQTRRIAFRHHILFDFAVSKLILQPDPIRAVLRFSKAEGAGLLIAPSLEYWLQHLKINFTTLEYWKLITSLISSETTDPVIRVEMSRIAFHGVENGEDLSDLSYLLSSNETEQKKAIIQIAGTLITYGVTTDSSEIWARMISGITGITEPFQFQSIKVILHVLIEASLSPEALNAVGKVARILFDEISKEDRLIQWLSPSIIPFVAKTYVTNPKETKQRLEQLFAEERFKKFGYLEIPVLADEAVTLGFLDDDLVAKIYRRVFAGGEFSREQKTALGQPSWILSLNSNAAQDFDMAEYTLSATFLKLIKHSPKAGIRALGAAIDANPRRWNSEGPDIEYKISYRDGQMTFEEDFSTIGEGDLFGRDKEENIYRIFQEWVAVADESLLQEIPDIMMSESCKALAWKALLEAAAARPKVLGKIMWNSAIDMAVLSSMTTRQAAIEMIVAAYPHVNKEQRSSAEIQILAYKFSNTKNPEYYANLIITSVLEAIGSANLVSVQAKDFLKIENEVEVVYSSQEESKKGSMLIHIPDEVPDVIVAARNKETISSLYNSIKLMLSEKTYVELAMLLWPEVNKLVGLINSELNELNGELGAGVALTLAKALGMALKDGWVPEDEVDNAVSTLLSLSKHTSPLVNAETEKDFERFPTWSGNSVRVEVAEIIGELVEVSTLWPKVRERYQELVLSDPHPAVRMQAIIRLLGLWDIDREMLLGIADKFVESESNSSVLGYGAGELARLRSAAVESIEPLFLKLANKEVSTVAGKNVVPTTISYFAVVRSLPASLTMLKKWIADFQDYEKQLHSTLFSLRAYLLSGYSAGSNQATISRKNVITFLEDFIRVLEPFILNWPNDREATEAEVAALKLFTKIGQQLYFAVGYHKAISLSLDAQKEFLVEYGPLISKLTKLGSPKTIHDCLQVLEKLIEANPVYCFELISEAMLRKNGVAKYEYEPSGAKLFVNLVSLFLTDYRYILTDEMRRSQLVDCLAVFVDAGWPEARRLFQALPDLR